MVGKCEFCHGATGIGCPHCMPENFQSGDQVFTMPQVPSREVTLIITRRSAPPFVFHED